jgi:hypothetical protein
MRFGSKGSKMLVAGLLYSLSSAALIASAVPF